MALSLNTVFECNPSATAANANGGGFNPSNTHFLTDGAATVATGNSPVFTSASYNFVAGDVGAWIYIKSGTNWNKTTYYQIASVATNAATLSAAIGTANVVINTVYTTNTAAGCGTSATLSGATWGIDYSRSTAAVYSNSVLTGTTTSCTDATNPFTTQMVGNLIHLSSGTGVTVGWYEIVSVSAGTATLDRSAGTSYSAVVASTGGALSLGSSTANQTDNTVLSLAPAAILGGDISGRTFISPGSYTIAVAVTTNAGNYIQGYSATRGDTPTAAQQPVFSCGANTFILNGMSSTLQNIHMTGSKASGSTLSGAAGSSNLSQVINCFVSNTSTTGTSAISAIAVALGNEAVCYAGSGINMNSGGTGVSAFGNYVHDCATYGIIPGAPGLCGSNIIAGCVTGAIQAGVNGGPIAITNNTLYGTENKLGIGFDNFSNGNAQLIFMNNIVYGFVTGTKGIASTTTQIFAAYDDYNCYFNNTANTSATDLWPLGAHDIFVNPTFTSVAQVTGTTATSATNVLTDSGKNFTSAGVVAGRDYLYVVSATGSPTIGIYYGITSVGTTTLNTDNALGTGSAITYQITTGRNFLPTGAI